jgi:hypothetical protein
MKNTRLYLLVLLLATLPVLTLIAECGYEVCCNSTLLDCSDPCDDGCTWAEDSTTSGPYNSVCDTGAGQPNRACQVGTGEGPSGVDTVNYFYRCNSSCDCDFGQPDGSFSLVNDGPAVPPCSLVHCGE